MFVGDCLQPSHKLQNNSVSFLCSVIALVSWVYIKKKVSPNPLEHIPNQLWARFSLPVFLPSHNMLLRSSVPWDKNWSFMDMKQELRRNIKVHIWIWEPIVKSLALWGKCEHEYMPNGLQVTPQRFGAEACFHAWRHWHKQLSKLADNCPNDSSSSIVQMHCKRLHLEKKVSQKEQMLCLNCPELFTQSTKSCNVAWKYC